MGKWDVGFDDYEEREGGYAGETPKRGTYDGVLVALAEHTSGEGNEGLEWIFEITDGEYKGWRGWTYSNMDSTKWRTQDIVFAISGGKKEGLKLDPAEEKKDGPKSKTVKKAMPVRLHLVTEMYDDEKKAKIKTVLPNLKASEAKKDKKKKSSDDPV